MFSFFKKREGNEKKEGTPHPRIMIVAALIGILLLLFGDRIPLGKAAVENVDENTDGDELILYQSYLENRVKSLCESVSGVSHVTAVVSLSGGFESIYATQIDGDAEEYVVIGSGSSAEALFLSRAAPEIRGIGIVCRGGSNPSIKQELTSLLGATFHVASNRIYITEAKF